MVLFTNEPTYGQPVAAASPLHRGVTGISPLPVLSWEECERELNEVARNPPPSFIAEPEVGHIIAPSAASSTGNLSQHLQQQPTQQLQQQQKPSYSKLPSANSSSTAPQNSDQAQSFADLSSPPSFYSNQGSSPSGQSPPSTNMNPNGNQDMYFIPQGVGGSFYSQQPQSQQQQQQQQPQRQSAGVTDPFHTQILSQAQQQQYVPQNHQFLDTFPSQPIAAHGPQQRQNLSTLLDPSANHNPIPHGTSSIRSNSSDEELSSSLTGAKKSSKSAGSSSKDNKGLEEDEDIIIKRKAQNRAAQRAFRERKEARVRELMEKLAESENEKKRLFNENERLKKENTVITTENQVLLATTTTRRYNDYDDDEEEETEESGASKTGGREEGTKTKTRSSAGISKHSSHRLPLKAVFPVHRFNFELLREHDEEQNLKTYGIADLRQNNDSVSAPSYIVYEEALAGETMLGAGAVWEMITQQHDAEDINIQQVMNYIKGKERCDGFGPVFKTSDVMKGIELARESLHSTPTYGGPSMDLD